MVCSGMKLETMEERNVLEKNKVGELVLQKMLEDTAILCLVSSTLDLARKFPL